LPETEHCLDRAVARAGLAPDLLGPAEVGGTDHREGVDHLVQQRLVRRDQGPDARVHDPETTRSLRRVTGDELHERFTAWLTAQVGAPVTVDAFTVPGHGGFSNETYVTGAEWDGVRHGLVLRLAPAGLGLFPD